MEPNAPRNDRPVFSPLKTEIFWILLSLAEAPRHGYGMLAWIAGSSGGQVRLGTGQMYRHLKRLLDDGRIEEAPLPDSDGNTDPRRKYYRLSETGRRHLAAECGRLEQTVRLTRGLGLSPENRR